MSSSSPPYHHHHHIIIIIIIISHHHHHCHHHIITSSSSSYQHHHIITISSSSLLWLSLWLLFLWLMLKKLQWTRSYQFTRWLDGLQQRITCTVYLTQPVYIPYLYPFVQQQLETSLQRNSFHSNSQHYKTLFLNFIATMSITNFCTKSMFTYRYLRHLQAKLQTKKMNPGPTRTRFITEAKL